MIKRVSCNSNIRLCQLQNFISFFISLAWTQLVYIELFHGGLSKPGLETTTLGHHYYSLMIAHKDNTPGMNRISFVFFKCSKQPAGRCSKQQRAGAAWMELRYRGPRCSRSGWRCIRQSGGLQIRFGCTETKPCSPESAWPSCDWCWRLEEEIRGSCLNVPHRQLCVVSFR